MKVLIPRGHPVHITIYEVIGPFCSSMGRGSQVRIIDDEDNTLTVKLRGLPVGPVKREIE